MFLFLIFVGGYDYVGTDTAKIAWTVDIHL